MARGEELVDGVASDESGGAGDEDVAHRAQSPAKSAGVNPLSGKGDERRIKP
jgi:hypothetical protein